jgi:8-oxo-dGTP pyrophosphatase MutT (NUDIX family)
VLFPAGRQATTSTRIASVALVFTRQFDLLFMTRASHDEDPWSGHISFPGGHMEASDTLPLHAAIRETHEELGLELTVAQCLGPLNQVQTPPAPDLSVHPFVFMLGERPSLTPDATEVKRTHWLSLESLLNGDNRSDFLFRYAENTVRLPCVQIGDERLWGLSLRIVDDLLNRIDGKGIGLDRGVG